MLSKIKRTFSFINHHPIGKKNLMLAYSKFFWWQIKSNSTKKYIKQQFIENTHFWAKKGLTGITGNIYVGLHEFEDMSFLLHLLTKDDTFYDVGANVGVYTILASGVRKAKTLAFEPIPSTFEILNKNIQLNNINELAFAQNNGVGSKEEILNFTKEQDTTNNVAADVSISTIPVSVVPLDNFYPKHIPCLLKIDVEGFELEVLKGAVQTLADNNLKAIIIEINGSSSAYGSSDIKIHEMLTLNSFYPFTYDPFKRALTKKERFGTFNTIYIRDLPFVKRRIKSSPKFRLFREYI